jgi:RHS repeat-associated protein
VYDDNGWVLSETNALNEQTVRTYDANGNELSVTDPLNRKTEYVVDPRGNINQEKDPMGAITQRSWGLYNQMYTETDALNRLLVTNTYARNLLSGTETAYMSSTKDALGNVTQTPVDICGSTCPNTGNLKGIIDPLGNRTSFTYDRYGNVTGETDALGNVTARTYDSMGRLLQESRTRLVDGVAQTLTTKNTYDAKGQLIQVEHPDGSLTKTTYDAIGKVTAETDANNRTTRYEYDSTGRQTAMIYADNTRETTIYDPEGNEISKTDRAGRTTKMVYDAANRLVETIYPDQTPTDDADNPRTKSVYDKAGQLIASINERNQRTEYEYDLAGRQTKTTDALGNVTTHAYDLSGRRLSSTDALGRTIKFTYDLAGKLTETIYPDPISEDADETNNPRTKMEYDAAGRKIAELDELGRKTTFQYDGLSRLIGVTLAAHTATPFTTTYAYDEQGNKTTQTDALGRVTAWTYDKNGRNLTRKLPLGQTESFAYNTAGERTQHTTFNNEVMSYTYDGLGRIASINFPGATTRTFTYNTAGQISEINDKGSIYRFAYDERDRLIEATDSENRKIGYQYDAAGNRTQLASPGMTVAYSYDELNRLSEVVANLVGQAANQRSLYAYDAVGNRQSQTNANRSTVAYQYDRRNRLSNLAHKTAAGALMLGMAYTVDASGLRTNIVETKQNGATTTQTRSAGYQYDALKRLTQSTITGATAAQNLTEVFIYDKVGNRLTRNCTGQLRTCANGLNTSTTVAAVSTTNTYDANDRLTKEVWGINQSGTFDYAYDNAGNLLSKKQSTTTLATYTWDAENHLTQAVMTPTGTSGNKTTTRYAYDANGIRRASEVIAQTVGAGASITKTKTNFLIDPNQAYAQVLEDWTAKATLLGATEPTTLPEQSLQNSYVFGDDLIAEARYAALTGTQTPRDLNDGGNDINARIGAITGNSALHYDGLGSTRLLTTISLDGNGAQLPGSGDATDQYAYTGFGESDIASTTGVTENAYRFTGEAYDNNLSWYNHRARWMNPAQGRFIGMDVFDGRKTQPSTLHKYAYSDSDPANRIDPSGHMTTMDVLAGPSMISNLSTIALPSLVQAVTRVSVRLLLAFGTAALGGSSTVVSNARAKEEARATLRDLVIAKAIARSRNSQTLYHYTDPAAAMEIMATQELKCTPTYRGNIGGGVTYPAGAYATDIEPWNPFTTQRMLGNYFFGGNQHRNLTWFAALDGEEFNPVYGGTNTWVRECIAGEFVPVDVYYIGPSLLDP